MTYRSCTPDSERETRPETHRERPRPRDEARRSCGLRLRPGGGEAGTSPLIRNYPGFPHGLSGEERTNRTTEQAWLFGANIVIMRAHMLTARGADRIVALTDGSEVTARSASHNRAEPVSVVGGGNAAGQAALHLAKYAASVTIVVRGSDLRARPHVRIPSHRDQQNG